MELDILGTPAQEGTLDLVTETVKPVPPDEAIQKANKYAYAVSKPESTSEMYERVMMGYDQELRRRYAADEQAMAHGQKQQAIMSFVETVKQSGRSLDQNDVAYIQSLNTDKIDYLTRNPDSYFEKKLAQKTVEDATKDASERALEMESMASSGTILPDRTLEGMESYLTKQSLFQELYNDTAKQVSERGLGGDIVDTLLSFSGVSSWYNTLSSMKGSELLQGNRIEETVQRLLLNPDPDAAYEEAKQIRDELASLNLNDALLFTQYLQQYGSQDQFLENLNSILTAGGVATGFTATAITRGVMKAAGRRGATLPKVLNAAGDTFQAGLKNTLSDLEKQAANAGARVEKWDDVAGQMPGFQDVGKALDDDTSSLDRSVRERLKARLQNVQEQMIRQGYLEPINITRLEKGTDAYKAFEAAAIRDFNTQYPEAVDMIQDIDVVSSTDNKLGNVDFLRVRLGRKDGLAFEEEYLAESIARLNGFNPADYKIVPVGGRYHIEITKTFDETNVWGREALKNLIETKAPTPQTMTNRIFGYFRPNDAVLPDDINVELKAATTQAQALSELNRALINEAIGALGKGASKLWKDGSRKDFVSFLEHQNYMEDPRAPGRRGHYSRSLGEFERDWMAFHKRMPTETEAEAYFTAKLAQDVEHSILNMAEYTRKARQGIQNFHFRRAGQKLNKRMPSIEGKLLDKLPTDLDEAAGVFVHHDTVKGMDASVPYYSTKGSANQLSQLHDLIDNQGYKVVRLTKQGEQAYRKYPGITFPKGRIDYVLVRDYESSPLGLNQIPYRPGGHVIYRDPYFISQPKLTTFTRGEAPITEYDGDVTVMSARSEGEAKRTASLLEGGRQLLVRGDKQGLREYLMKNKLPFTYRDFTAMFDASRGGVLDANTPIYFRPKGSNTVKHNGLDRNFINFRDLQASRHHPENADVQTPFSQERDFGITQLENVGSDLNPVFNLRPARVLDPISAMARSNAMAMRGKFLEPLKAKSAERFIAEFSDVLDFDGDPQLQPIRALFEGKIKSDSAKVEKAAAAKIFQSRLQNFFSTKSEDAHLVDAIMNKLYQSIPGFDKAADWVEPFLLHTVTDPARFFRQTAFYAGMGFFNPKQYFLQLQGVLQTAALEPAHALKAFGAANLMRPLHMAGSKKIHDGAADMAVSLGWKREHFLEAWEAMNRIRWNHVGGEYGIIDDFLNPSINTSGSRKVLEAGLAPWRGGERMNRITAWNAAYLRWRTENPIAKFDDKAIKGVQARADLLTNNMTRASQAGFNNGFASLPTQFLSYQSRLMDLMLGKRLTTAEKARLAAVNSFLYGVPTATAGAALGVLWPWDEQAKEYARSYGIDTDQPGWKSFLDGVPAAMIAIASDGEINPDPSTYGPGGISLLKDIWGEGVTTKSAAELLGGPGIATAAQLLAAVGTTGSVLLDTLISDTPLRPEDFRPLVDTVATGRNLARSMEALAYQKYYMKNQENTHVVDNLNAWDAAFIGIFGMTPMEVSNFWIDKNIQKDLQAHQRKYRTKIVDEMNRLAKAQNVEEIEDIKRRIQAAKELGMFTESAYLKIIGSAFKAGNKSEYEKLEERLQGSSRPHLERHYERMGLR